MSFKLLKGDCREVMKELEGNSIDSIVTDPPYGIAFMSEAWDTMSPKQYEEWCREWGAEALRIAKPGAHIIAFSATRTHHRLMSGLEDAGWEIRDCGVWLYRSGMPKFGNVSIKIDEHLGAEREVVGYRTLNDPQHSRLGFSGMTSKDGTTKTKKVPVTVPATDEAKEWDGWAGGLKPCIEPWVLARKPMEGTLVENLLKWGVGALNIDRCRTTAENRNDDLEGTGRWSPNAITLEDDEELTVFRILGHQVADFKKAPSSERPYTNGEDENIHVTVKPLDLMRWLVRLVTPEFGTVLDPFVGSGTTLEAAQIEGRNGVGIEIDERYIPIIERRLSKPIQPSFGF